MDLNRVPNHDVPLWGEGRWSGSWNADAGVGMFIHAGRFRQDLDMWWARTVAYLPDGKLAVDRTWGRAPDDLGLRTGTVSLRSHETGWSSTFDGVGELTDARGMATGTRGNSAPSVPLSWEINAEASSPPWGMSGDLSGDQDFASEMYVQQSFATTGTMTAGGETYDLAGIGFMDHSCGARDWTDFGSHHFALVVMPDFTLHDIVVFKPDGELRSQIGVFFDQHEHAIPLEGPRRLPLEDAVGAPYAMDLVVSPDGRDPITLGVEMLHTLPICITHDNDNINGVDWDIAGNPLVVVAGIAKFTAPDGSVGFGHLERSLLRDKLVRPQTT